MPAVNLQQRQAVAVTPDVAPADRRAPAPDGRPGIFAREWRGLYWLAADDGARAARRQTMTRLPAAARATPSREPRLFAIVLAAGRSERFGAVKQLAQYRGQPLAARALRIAESVCSNRTVLVTGHHGAAVHAACAPIAGFRVHNSDYRQGLASSIAHGVAAVRHAADGVLLLLADQPLIDQQHLARLAECWSCAPERVVATAYADKSGVPVIFPRRLFDDLCKLTGDTGAQPLLQRCGSDVLTIHCEAAATDIDRPEDLAVLTAETPQT